jgi:hypothetical protein
MSDGSEPSGPGRGEEWIEGPGPLGTNDLGISARGTSSMCLSVLIAPSVGALRRDAASVTKDRGRKSATMAGSGCGPPEADRSRRTVLFRGNELGHRGGGWIEDQDDAFFVRIEGQRRHGSAVSGTDA